MDLVLLRDHPLLTLTAAAYAAALVCYVVAWRSPRVRYARTASLLMLAALELNAGLVILRWIAVARPPFRSLFESLVFGALCVTVAHLVLEKVHRTRAFGALAAAASLSALVYALLRWDAEILELPLALQSPWYVPHLVAYLFGYAALAFATAVAMTQLIRPRLRVQGAWVDLERISYGALKFGFLMLTLGLLAGLLWAKRTFGDWWTSNPQENGSLATWLVFAVYLHLRRVKGWRGRRAATLAIAGFGLVVVAYVGMEVAHV